MPWKESSVMEERLRFVARLLDGEAMTDMCREFGISRKTGYKIFDRYKEHGLSALTDRSRRPVRYANQLPQQIEGLIVRLKAEKPHWGARKIRELLVRRLDGDVRVPAKSIIHVVLDRHGLVKRGGGPRHRARGTPLSEGAMPNDLWCADFKGEFKLGNRRYCYPLTVTDHASRFLLLCEALESTREDLACTAFERLFRERGLPLAIRERSLARRQRRKTCQSNGRKTLSRNDRCPTPPTHQRRKAPSRNPCRLSLRRRDCVPSSPKHRQPVLFLAEIPSERGPAASKEG